MDSDRIRPSITGAEDPVKIMSPYTLGQRDEPLQVEIQILKCLL